MAARYLLVIAVVCSLVASSGCCLVRRVLCDECCGPCETGAFTYFAGRSCGERYCGDWQSQPPKCDPCDDCGRFVGCSDCGPMPYRPTRSMPLASGRMAAGGECESCGAL